MGAIRLSLSCSPSGKSRSRLLRFIKRRPVVGILLLALLVGVTARLPGPGGDDGHRSGSGLDIAADDGVSDEKDDHDLGLEPIKVSSNQLCRVIEDHAAGGTVVIPDGIYVACDLADFRPAKPLNIVSQTLHGAVVVRQGDEIGDTVFRISDSSHLTFVGVRFDAINVAVLRSNDIGFHYTHHSFPVERHPDPTNSWCGEQRGPNTMEIQRSDRITVAGSDFADIGNDGIRIERSDHVTVEGVVVTDVWHDLLQSGNENGECGNNDGSNYHTDGLQIIDGESDDLIIRDSYFGQRLVLTVDGDGVGGNDNMVLERLWLVAELPDSTNCVTMAMKVKDNASPDATQSAVVNDVESFCDPSIEGTRHFDVSGSEERLTINGRPTRAAQRNADEELAAERRVIPPIDDSPAQAWRDRNTYGDLVQALVAPANTSFSLSGSNPTER